MNGLLVAGGAWCVAMACSLARAPQATHAQRQAVTISQFRFAPAELTVALGDTVVWTNADALLHTTTADSGAWSSPEMPEGERFTFVASRTGRFPYHCAAHPSMRATLTVRR